MMPVKKNILEKIVDFLRKNGGEAEISIAKIAAELNCHPSHVSNTLSKLALVRIIEKVRPAIPRKRQPARYALSEQFREGEGWCDLFAQRLGAGKAKLAAPAGAAGVKCQSEECLNAKRVLLGELIEVYEKLKARQEENRTLRLNLAELQKESAKREQELEDLSNKVEKMRKINSERRAEVEMLEDKLRTLRTQTSQPMTEKRLRFDDSCVMILPGEGLPDRS